MAAQSKGWSTGALLLACSALAVVVALELTEDLPIAPEVTAAPPPALELPPQEVVEYRPPSRGEFDVIAMRPLFSVSRRPFEPEAAPAPEAGSDESAGLPEVQLVGVLLSATQRAALFAPADGEQGYWLNEGQMLEGWVIESVERDRAILRRAERTATLELRPD